MLISEAIKTFTDYLKGDKSPNTVSTYIFHLNDFIKTIGDKHIEDLTIEDIISYRAICSERGLSTATKATKLSALAALATFCRKAYKNLSLSLIPNDITDLRPTVESKIPRYTEIWQVSTLIEVCEDIEEEIIIRLLFTSGIRSKEFLLLTEDNLQEDQSDPDKTLWIKIIGKRNKERRIPLNQETKEILKKYIEYLKLKTNKPLERLFPYSYSTLWYRIKKIAKRVGMEYAVSPHAFRHGFGTELLAQGEDIRVINELMGHASMNTTKRYTKVKPEGAKRTVSKLMITPVSSH
jgi:site-specific recombinase XerD